MSSGNPAEDAFVTASFRIFVPAYVPETVSVRLPVPVTVHRALTHVSAARDPLARLRFPRLLPVRMQTVSGYATLIAAPAWPMQNICVLFDSLAVNGRLFCMDVPPVMHWQDILRLLAIPTDCPVLVFAGDVPWPTATDAVVALREGDAVHVVPADHPAIVVTELQFMPALRVVSDPGSFVHRIQPGRFDRLILRPAVPYPVDHEYRGEPVTAVVVAKSTEAGRRHDAPRSLILCCLDLRPILLDFSWVYVEDGRLSYELLLARFLPRCPRGYVIGCSTGDQVPAARPSGIPIVDGQVVVVVVVVALAKRGQRFTTNRIVSPLRANEMFCCCCC